MEISIRSGRESDSSNILKIMKAAFSTQEGKIDPPSSINRETEQSVIRKFYDGNFLVAEFGKQMVACLYYKLEKEKMYVGRLSVLPEFQGLGLGKRLMDQVKEIAADRGVDLLEVNVRIALEQNQIERNGFRFSQFGFHEGYSKPTFMTLRHQLG